MSHATTNSPRADYQQDEHAWLLDQAALLHARDIPHVDFYRLSKFLADMAKRDERELRSRLIVLTTHILKCETCPDRVTRSWILTIKEQQDEVRQILKASSSLLSYISEHESEIMDAAVDRATIETGRKLPEFTLQPADTEFEGWYLNWIMGAKYVPAAHPSAPARRGFFGRR